MSDTDDLLLDAWRAFGKQYNHNGHNVFYREEGEGPVLLCIHGFPTASWDWHRIWGSLTSHYRVIAPDMLGFGFSDKPKQYDYTIADHTDLHEGLIENLGIDSVSILAHDMGDTVVQELLARDVDRPGHKGLQIRKVCLLNGGLFPETTRPRPIQKLLAGPLGGLVARMLNRRRFGASIARVFGGNTKPSNADLDAFWRLISFNNGHRRANKVIRYMKERRQFRNRWVNALTRTQIPVRLVLGLEDPVSGEHIATRYRDLVAEPDIVSLPGIGHFPQLEDPDAVLQAVLPFFGNET